MSRWFESRRNHQDVLIPRLNSLQQQSLGALVAGHVEVLVS